MTDKLDAPVIAYRRWSVTGGWLYGLGVPVKWEPGVQDARCAGTVPVTVADYCDPPPLDAPRPDPYTYFGAGPGPWPLPDGRWATLVEKRTCNGAIPLDHQVPSLESKCGLWAHRQPIPNCACDEPAAPHHGAVGVVRMWGRAVEHTDGWRAEHAEVVALVDHSNTVRRDYWVPRYATTAEMYAEWAPDAHGWAARHDRRWCDGPMTRALSTSGVQFHRGGVITGYSQGFNTNTIIQAMLGHQPYSWGVSPHAYDVPEAKDPKAKALKDKQTRNANHPAQDRPEKSKRRRFLR